MIIVLKKGTAQKDIDSLTQMLTDEGVQVNPVIGTDITILGLVGDTTQVDPNRVESYDCVDRIMHVAEPFKKANRMFHPENSVIDVAGVPVGGKGLAVMAGPCSVESREQVTGIAKAVKAAGGNILRGGAFKPRTSPYTFQGLGSEGVRLLVQAGRESGLPTVTEITDASQLETLAEVDVLQVGARNMQNFALLRALGRQKKPVLLKRGLAATYEEWLASAEYILREGNPNVVLCERGIRSYQSGTRGTLDLAAVPVMHSLTHLPVLVDPSHAAGVSEWVSALGRAAAAAGADGLMVEVHPNPEAALSDGEQALLPEEFARLADAARRIAQR